MARSARALKVGTLRPAIVLYDEPHPLGDDIGMIQTMDLGKKPDMLVIMGTSLKVHGLKKLVKDFARVTHASAPTPASGSSPKNEKQFVGKVIFVNKTPPGSEWDGIIDYHVSGDTDTWADKVIEDWKKSKPADWEMQKTLVSTEKNALKVVKDLAAGKLKGLHYSIAFQVLSLLMCELSCQETKGKYPSHTGRYRTFILETHLTDTAVIPQQTTTIFFALFGPRKQSVETARARNTRF